MEKFYKRLKQLREDVLKKTMNEMSVDLYGKEGFQPKLSQYEKNVNKPSYVFIEALCNIYGVSANWLILGVGPIMIKDLSTSTVDTTSIMVKKHKEYGEKLNNIQNQLKNAIEEYKRKL